MPLSFWLHKKNLVFCVEISLLFLQCCFSLSKLHTQRLSAGFRTEDALVLRERDLSLKKILLDCFACVTFVDTSHLNIYLCKLQ